VEIEYDVWFDNRGEAFGEECYRLLEAVEKTGSLNRAANDVNLSFCGALRTLQRSEKRLGFPLLERKIGGVCGGGSHLTPEGRLFMERYRQFRHDLSETIPEIFKEHFNYNQPPEP
jgi:molybdate transport system regulatory protein